MLWDKTAAADVFAGIGQAERRERRPEHGIEMVKKAITKSRSMPGRTARWWSSARFRTTTPTPLASTRRPGSSKTSFNRGTKIISKPKRKSDQDHADREKAERDRQCAI